MKEIKFEKSRMFWILHTAGWFIFAFLVRFYEGGDFFLPFKSSLLFLLTYLIGFILTLRLRFVYQIIYKKVHSIVVILLIIIIASAITLIVWEPSDVLISLPLWEKGELASFLNTYSPFTLGRYYQKNLFWFMFILMWSILFFGIKNWYEHMDQRIRAEKALKLANDAQLIMLRYQLNPHFLFNSLNSIKALTYENPEQAGYMLKKGADVNAMNNNGFTPLFYAKEVNLARLLIEKGADIQKGNPVAWALVTKRREVAEYLLEKGAVLPEIGTSQGILFLARALRCGSVRFLENYLQQGFDPLYESQSKNNLVHYAAVSDAADLIERLTSLGVAADKSNKFGWRPLHIASVNGNLQVVQKLLKKGVTINARNPDGRELFFVGSLDGKYTHFWVDTMFIEELRLKEKTID